MNSVLLINDVWGSDPNITHHPVANYFLTHQIVETKIKPLLEECRRWGYLVVHYGRKWSWSVDIRKGERDIAQYGELHSLLSELQPERIFLVGFHTNICIKTLIENLVRDFGSETVILVKDATLGIWKLHETKGNINDKYINRLIDRTEHYIGATDWETTTTAIRIKRRSN